MTIKDVALRTIEARNHLRKSIVITHNKENLLFHNYQQVKGAAMLAEFILKHGEITDKKIVVVPEVKKPKETIVNDDEGKD